MLVFAVAVVLGGALISTAEQLAAERERLARSLPAARPAYLGMEQDSLGLAALRERPTPTAPPLAALPDSIRAAASASWHRRRGADRRRSGGSRRPCHPACARGLLATLHAEQRLRPTRLELQTAGTDGLARFDAMFEVGGQ